ncbi:MAG: hydrogenase maturation protease [Gammaproteobacteria bacterium]|nr:hydrogenase maturation protease [Gammaproteobacteria bacterium]
MKKIIGVIGIGSSFGADNIAQDVINLLKKHTKNKFQDTIQFEYYDRPGIYLLEIIKKFKVVHLIDAVVSENTEGTLHRYENLDVLQAENFLLSSHGVGVAEALALGKILNCLPQKIIVHGIEIENSKTIKAISREIIQARDELVSKIVSELTSQVSG